MLLITNIDDLIATEDDIRTSEHTKMEKKKKSKKRGKSPNADEE